LVVDDDDGLRALLRTTFEAVDVDVDEAADADEARQRIIQSSPDAIVLDVSMPGQNGVSFRSDLNKSRMTHHS